jgi:hypothetical protein
MSLDGGGTCLFLLLKRRFINASKKPCGLYQVNFHEPSEHPIYQPKQSAILIYSQSRAEIS